MTIAYHASHEQFSPSELLDYVRLAEDSGFTAIHSSDHFHPWSYNQGQCGFSFSWIPAAMQITTVPFSMVCAPGQRYHPAIVAQAIATIAEMFPERFTVELGSGEAINEGITGQSWPNKIFRNKRLIECFRVITDLLSGKTVHHKGTFVVKNARLFSLPKTVPSLFCAALSEETCAWAGHWAQGLLTTGGHANEVTKKVNAFHADHEKKPVFIQQAFSFDKNLKAATEGAMHQWRNNLVSMEKLANISTIQEFEKEGRNIGENDIRKNVLLITSIEQLVPLLKMYRKMNIDRVILHNINRNQTSFLRAFSDIASVFN